MEVAHMVIYVGFVLSFFLLIFSVLKGIFIGYALIACGVLFSLIGLIRGYSFKEIGKMAYNGGKQSFTVVAVLVLIGAVTGAWMASGTTPALVYYSLRFITPSLFIFSTFIISCTASFLLGSSLGTVSIVGIPLMIMARSGNLDLNMAAGAIIAGAYFGDRCSPMSSSAALIASLTRTNIFVNIKNMVYTSIIPFTLTAVFYFSLSVSQPVSGMNSNLPYAILGAFKIDFVLLVPVLVIIILSLCRVKIHISILLSILSAALLAVFFQHLQPEEVMYSLLSGFRARGSALLQSVIKGGGIVSMLKPSLVVFASCSLAGIFKGIKVFERIKGRLMQMQLARHKLFGITSIVSMATAAFGCNQTISSVLTSEIMKDCYEGTDKHQFALHLENSGILIAALIPWNIAALVPTTTLGVSMTGYIPYAFYLYLLPLIYFISSGHTHRLLRITVKRHIRQLLWRVKHLPG